MQIHNRTDIRSRQIEHASGIQHEFSTDFLFDDKILK